MRLATASTGQTFLLDRFVLDVGPTPITGVRGSTRTNTYSLFARQATRRLSFGQLDTSQDAPNDGELVRRCQVGDLSAFDDLVTRYKSKVFTMVYGMVRAGRLGSLQEGFLNAWRSIHRFKGQSSFYTWLYQIMTNVTIDALRRKGGRGGPSSMIGLHPMTWPRPPEPGLPHHFLTGN